MKKIILIVIFLSFLGQESKSETFMGAYTCTGAGEIHIIGTRKIEQGLVFYEGQMLTYEKVSDPLKVQACPYHSNVEITCLEDDPDPQCIGGNPYYRQESRGWNVLRVILRPKRFRSICSNVSMEFEFTTKQDLANSAMSSSISQNSEWNIYSVPSSACVVVGF